MNLALIEQMARVFVRYAATACLVSLPLMLLGQVVIPLIAGAHP